LRHRDGLVKTAARSVQRRSDPRTASKPQFSQLSGRGVNSPG